MAVRNIGGVVVLTPELYYATLLEDAETPLTEIGAK